jgi:hypothetical protein
MRAFMISAALAAGVVAAAAAPASALGPAGTIATTASGVTPAQYSYHHRRHHRGGWVPYRLRGFKDPGYAYHGNLNGCAVDLGYGRWESCDVGR